MYIGEYYYTLPNSLMELNVTSFYFVAFSFLVFCLSRPFKSLLRPYILLLGNVMFIYSFGINNLIYILIFSLVGYLLSFLIKGSKKILYISYILLLGSLFLFKVKNINDESFMIPLGLSFYTFKIISYLVDIYNDKCVQEINIIHYLDYVMFFPCISAGPINKANYFLNELKTNREFEYTDVSTGALLLAYGLFEKLVFCDYIGDIVSRILDNEELYGLNVLFGVVLYSFQIYLDFDSYSNIAIGIARMLGFKLDKNFNVPYLARSIKDFWTRWHISLTTWLRDYIYIPLGGSKKGVTQKYLNIIIVFLFSALWHGTSINFIIWGLGHALFRIVEDFIPDLFYKFPKQIKSIVLIVINFIIVSFLWIFFRNTNLKYSIDVINRIFINGSLNLELVGLTHNEVTWLIVVLCVVIVLDILRYFFDVKEFLGKRIFILRYAIYVVLILTFLIFGMYGGSFDANDFIYRWF